MAAEDDPFGMESAALAAANVGTGGLLHDLAHLLDRLGIRTAAARVNASVAQDYAEWMEERIIDLERGYQELREKGVDARTTDARAIVEGIDKAARATADPNKRKLLENAATRAFDLEVYESGLTLVMLGLLEDLTYGDVVLLREVASADALEKKLEATRRGTSASALPHRGWYTTASEGSLKAFHERRLVEAGLIRERGGNAWTTDLGHRLLALLSEPQAEDKPENSKP